MSQQYQILVVDDEPSITKSLQRLFRGTDYTIHTANSGVEALKILQGNAQAISLIISDQRMPQMTGSVFFEKAKKIAPDAIRFLLTGYSDMNAIVDAINNGEIHKYITKPWDNNDLILQVRQGIAQYELVMENRRLQELTKKQNKELFTISKSLQEKVKEQTIQLRQRNRELEGGLIDTTKLLKTLVESLDPAFGRYMHDVSRYCRWVAEQYGLEGDRLDMIEIAGMLHDVGLLESKELRFRDEREMSGEEQEKFQEHPMVAKMSIETVKSLAPIGKIVYHHHEQIDGNGFPDGLKGDDIPLESRIIGVVADYFRFIGYDQNNFEKIIRKSRKYFGQAVREFDVTEPEHTVHEIAKKVMLLQANQKYDLDVLSKFILKIDEDWKANRVHRVVQEIDVSELKEGMRLAKALRTKAGSVLLKRGMVLDRSRIDSIEKLHENGVIEGAVLILDAEKSQS